MNKSMYIFNIIIAITLFLSGLINYFQGKDIRILQNRINTQEFLNDNMLQKIDNNELAIFYFHMDEFANMENNEEDYQKNVVENLKKYFGED